MSPTPIPLRRLGRNGPQVTRIGLGMAALGRPGYINLGHGRDLDGCREHDEMERHAHEMLNAAHLAGIRYVDCARSYGDAEAFVASWLRARGDDVDDVVVGSKWGYTYVADWRVDVDVHEVKDHSPATLERQLATSRDTLGGRLRLYQIHSATRESGVLTDRAVLARLAELRSDGIAVGLSTSGPAQAETIDDAIATGAFDTVQATFNALEVSAGPALRRAHEAGMGVIIKEAVANGRLTPRGDAAANARLVAAADGAGPDAAALAWVLAHDFVDCVLLGATTREQLTSNLGALDVEVDVPATTSLAEAPADYWAARAKLTWN